MTIKPKPEVIKLEFSEEDQEYIEAMLEGRPPPNIIKQWTKRGLDIAHKTKHYTCPILKDRMRTIQQKYKIGKCLVCQSIPMWRFVYRLEDVILLEYFCQQHVPQKVI